MTLVSEAWNDLGDRSKPVGAINPYRHFKPPPNHEYEASEIVEERRSRNLAVLQELRSIAEHFEEKGACVHMKIKGLAFDFFPATNTWISYAKNIYGTGIERIKGLIAEKLGV